MPTAFPRAIVYDPSKSCHLTVVVRRDRGYFSFFCAEHDTEEKYPMGYLDAFKRTTAALEDTQIVSWIEVDNGGD